MTVFLLPFYPYNGLYNKRRDIGRRCITFSPVVLPFVLQKFNCKGGFLRNIGINIGVLGGAGCPVDIRLARTGVERRRPLTRLETHCDFRILQQFLQQFLSERILLTALKEISVGRKSVATI